MIHSMPETCCDFSFEIVTPNKMLVGLFFCFSGPPLAKGMEKKERKIREKERKIEGKRERKERKKERTKEKERKKKEREKERKKEKKERPN